MISQELREGFQNREFSLRGGSTPFPTYPFYNVKHEHIDKKSTINAPPGGGWSVKFEVAALAQIQSEFPSTKSVSYHFQGKDCNGEF